MSLKIDGRSVNGERVAFEPLDEPWTKCKLRDGTIIRLKLVVADVIRLAKDKPTDETHYMVKSSNIMAIEEPETPDEVH